MSYGQRLCTNLGKGLAPVPDEEREICCFGIFPLREWTREEIPKLKWLLGIGAGLFEEA